MEAIKDIRTILRETLVRPMFCKDLVAGWPDYIWIANVSSHGVGGVVLGKLSGIPPTVFQIQWPQDITKNLVTLKNQGA
jgi:hypothetical protein